MLAAEWLTYVRRDTEQLGDSLCFQPKVTTQTQHSLFVGLNRSG